MDRDKFFAMLDQLNTSQIEARLPSWDDEQLKLVEEYLERRTIKPALLKKHGAESVTNMRNRWQSQWQLKQTR